MTEVGKLKHSNTFSYSGHYYMRVNSVINSGQDRQNEGQRHHGQYLNCKEYVLVLKFANGRLSYFKRTTRVKEVDMLVEVTER